MSLRLIRLFAVGVLGMGLVCLPLALAQDSGLNRKVKTKVSPTYPEIAKKMSISGTVKLEVVVAPNGTIKSTKVMGGHPLLVDAAVTAVRKWKFETASDDSSGVIEFTFQPN